MKIIKNVDGIFLAGTLVCIWWFVLPENTSPAIMALKLALSALVILIDHKVGMVELPKWLFRGLQHACDLWKLVPYLLGERIFDIQHADFALLCMKSKAIQSSFDPEGSDNTQQRLTQAWRNLGHQGIWVYLGHAVLAVVCSLRLCNYLHLLPIVLLWVIILVPFLYLADLFDGGTEDVEKLFGSGATTVQALCGLVIVFAPIIILVARTLEILFSNPTISDGWWYTTLIVLGSGSHRLALDPSLIVIIASVVIILFGYAQLCQAIQEVKRLWPDIITEEDRYELYPLCPECGGWDTERSCRCPRCHGAGRIDRSMELTKKPPIAQDASDAEPEDKAAAGEDEEADAT